MWYNNPMTWQIPIIGPALEQMHRRPYEEAELQKLAEDRMFRRQEAAANIEMKKAQLAEMTERTRRENEPYSFTEPETTITTPAEYRTIPFYPPEEPIPTEEPIIKETTLPSPLPPPLLRDRKEGEPPFTPMEIPTSPITPKISPPTTKIETSLLEIPETTKVTPGKRFEAPSWKVKQMKELGIPVPGMPRPMKEQIEETKGLLEIQKLQHEIEQKTGFKPLGEPLQTDTGLQQRYQMPDGYVVTLPLTDSEGNTLNKKDKENLSDLGKLMQERNSFPIGHPDRKMYDVVIANKAAKGGFAISVDKDGNISIVQGGAAPITKKTTEALEIKLLNDNEAKARMAEIKATWKPEYLTYLGKGRAWWDKVRAKTGVGFMELSPEEKTWLTDFAQWRQTTIQNVNLYIKEITGAQMSEAEATRLMKAMPNEGDDPVTFKAKLDKALEQVDLAIQRHEYMQAHGITKVPTLEEFKAISGKKSPPTPSAGSPKVSPPGIITPKPLPKF